ncbi:MAG: hypothetical protein F6K31_14140 [Symploca sp. SIO2G7]|nr:hypothetical protein [Symploca sp. SIO2G7]
MDIIARSLPWQSVLWYYFTQWDKYAPVKSSHIGNAIAILRTATVITGKMPVPLSVLVN